MTSSRPATEAAQPFELARQNLRTIVSKFSDLIGLDFTSEEGIRLLRMQEPYSLDLMTLMPTDHQKISAINENAPEMLRWIRDYRDERQR